MSEKITDILSNIQSHVVMRDHTSFKIGGVADYFIEVKTVDELVKAVRAAFKTNTAYFILGNGTNVLFSDYGYPGLVIKNMTQNISIMREKSQAIADSGVLLSKLILQLVSNDLSGLEFLYGIPGSVGGAISSNAGAWGNSIGDYVKNVTILESDPETGVPKIQQHDSLWMEFGYRFSKLKNLKLKMKPVILTARFQLSQSQKEEIMRRLNKYKKLRTIKQPVGLSAGSIFKNPMPEVLKSVTGVGTKGMPEFPKERTAGYLLEKAGAKKLKVGGAEVSNIHANFIINKNNAKASEVRTLIEQMREKVKEKFDIELQEEIEYVGQW